MLPGYRIFLAICHFMTYVIILVFPIIFPLTKFNSLFLTLQQTLLNRTREIWWKNLTQWSSWNHILTSLNFWDVLQNLVRFGYALYCCIVVHILLIIYSDAFSSLIICLNGWVTASQWSTTKKPLHKIILSFLANIDTPGFTDRPRPNICHSTDHSVV